MSEYETQFIKDLQEHRHIVRKHDRRLRGVFRRHKLLILLHHAYRTSQDDREKVEATFNEEKHLIYKHWDSQVWSDYFGDCIA